MSPDMDVLDTPNNFSEYASDGCHAWLRPTPETLRRFEADAGIPAETSSRWDETMKRHFG